MIKHAHKKVKTEENVKVKILKTKKVPKPKSIFDEPAPVHTHHDNVPSEEDNTDEAKAIEAEAPAPKAPLPQMKEQPIVDANPESLKPKVKKVKKPKKETKSKHK